MSVALRGVSPCAQDAVSGEAEAAVRPSATRHAAAPAFAATAAAAPAHDPSFSIAAARLPRDDDFDLVDPELLVPPPWPIRSLSRTDAGVFLDGELVRLAAADSRCRLVRARIAGHLIERKAWRALGFVRLSDYCRERLGISPRSLQEDARVVKLLAALPIMRRALERGELTWTRARVLAGVATAANEEELLERSRAVPFGELEEWVRTWRPARGEEAESRGGSDAAASAHAPETTGDATADIAPQATGEAAGDVAHDADADADVEPTMRWSVRVSRSGRRMWRLARELASRTAGSPLSPSQALELVAAEAAGCACDLSDGSQAGKRWNPPPEFYEQRFREAWHWRRQRGRKLLLAYLAETGVAEGFAWLAPASTDPGPAASLAALQEGLEGADAFELEARLQRLRLLMQRLDAQMAALLRTGIDRRLFAEIGFASVKLYVRSRLGFCSRRAWSLVAIERQSWRRSRLLYQAWHDGCLSTLQATTLLPVLQEQNARAWIERAGHVTLRRLGDEVAWALDHGDGTASLEAPLPPPQGADVRLDAVADAGQAEVQNRAHGSAPHALLGPAGPVRLDFVLPISVAVLVETTLDGLARAGEPRFRTFERMVALAILEWASTPRHRDPVFERDGWRCAVPACSSRRNLHDHHVLFRSRGGGNARDNRVAVCTAHHLHGLHTGVVRARGRAPADIHWELGCARGRTPLLRLRGEWYETG